MTRGRLIAKAFALGACKSWTVILRRPPAASLVQSPMAALPVSSVPLSVAAATGAAKLELIAMQIAQKTECTPQRFPIHVAIASDRKIAWIGVAHASRRKSLFPPHTM